MIIYFSENKVNNIFKETELNKKFFNPFSDLKINLKIIVSNIAYSKNSIEYKFYKVIKYLKRKKKFKKIDNRFSKFKEHFFYQCHGFMFLHQAEETDTGLLVDLNYYEKTNKNLNFYIELENDYYNNLIVTCSTSNLIFLNNVTSLSSELIYHNKKIPVTVIFLLLNINADEKTLYGTPLLINYLTGYS